MAALQEQEGPWMSFNHLMAMIDHFKLDFGAANTHMSIQWPMLHRLWVKKFDEHAVCGGELPVMEDKLNVGEL